MSFPFLQRQSKIVLAALVAFCGTLISSLVIILVSTFGVSNNAQAVIINGAPAIDQIGSYDNDNTTTLTNLFTKSIQAFSANTLTRVGMETPSGLAFDGTNHRLFLSDTGNKRVLIYNLNSDNTLPDRIPDFVLGQTTFNTETAAVTAGGLSSPIGLAYDASGNRLFVADSTAHRVVVYDVASITNGEDAVNVLGQSSFTSSSSATSISGLNTPLGLEYDSVGSRLFVADSVNNRVIVYDVASITNGEDAVNELGQPSGTAFTSAAAATTAAGMSAPSGVLYDSANTRLYVMDKTNNRVTVFSVSSITNGQAATNVIGQADFVTATAGTTSQKLSAPRDAALDVTGNRLFVADSTNNRIMVFDVTTVSDNPVAINVLGQSLFTTATAATTQAGMKAPLSIVYDSTNSLLYSAESTNHRTIVHNVSAITNGEDAVNEIGQVDANNSNPFAADVIYTKGETNANPTRVTMRGDSSVTFDYVHHRMFLSDRFNNRVLIYLLDGNNRLLDKVPDFVLCQSDFNGTATATTASGCNSPMGTAYDPATDRLFLADSANRRILVFDVTTITNGESAVNVLGQTDFVTGTANTTQNGLRTPVDPYFDGSTNRLYVPDSGNHRVMIFDVATITDGENAINEIGQPNFVTGTSGVTQSKLNTPLFAIPDNAHNRLFVADDLNSRVTIYDITTIVDGEPAVNVLGQADFITSSTDTNAKGFQFIFGMDYDPVAQRLFVGDFFNNRILIFDVNTITDNEDAVNVLGQADFTSAITTVSQTNIQPVTCSEYNDSTRELFVCDPRMNRVMIFEASLGGSSARCEKPIVSIVSPNGNESYVGGSTQTLSYGYTSCAVSDVSVSLITEDGSAIPISLSDATRDISTGSLHWVVPSISTTHARLKISLLGSQGQVLATDESDADFTITTDQIGGVIEDEETSSDTLTALDLFKAEVSPLSINENFGFSNEAPESPLCISNTLIKDPVNAAVYYCGADGKRHVFVNAKVFYSWYSSFGSVITLSSETLNAIPVGENVAYRPRQRMIKLQSDAKVYAVSGGGVLHLIANEVIAEALYGKDWNTMIDDIADAFFVNYTAGAPLE